MSTAERFLTPDLGVTGIAELGESELTLHRGGDGGLTFFAMSMAVAGSFGAALIIGGIAAYVIYHGRCDC